MILSDLNIFAIFLLGMAVGLWMQYFWTGYLRRHM